MNDDSGDRLGKSLKKIRKGIYKQMAGTQEFIPEAKTQLSKTYIGKN